MACNKDNNDACYQRERKALETACDACRQKDGVGSCANRWKCVNEGDQCEGACILCNEDNNDACYQREMKDQT